MALAQDVWTGDPGRPPSRAGVDTSTPGALTFVPVAGERSGAPLFKDAATGWRRFERRGGCLRRERDMGARERPASPSRRHSVPLSRWGEGTWRNHCAFVAAVLGEW